MEKFAILIEAVDSYELLALADVIYGPYTKSDGRKIVIVVDDQGHRRTISFPKYLMEQHLGRRLDPDLCTIDHINRNFNDNDIKNLRIVPRDQHSADDTKRVKPAKFRCSMCKKKFERSPRLVRDKSRRGVSGVFCGRSCAGRYARLLQLGLIDKFPVQPYTESKYYRNKKVLAQLENKFAVKYGVI